MQYDGDLVRRERARRASPRNPGQAAGTTQGLPSPGYCQSGLLGRTLREQAPQVRPAVDADGRGIVLRSLEATGPAKATPRPNASGVKGAMGWVCQKFSFGGTGTRNLSARFAICWSCRLKLDSTTSLNARSLYA